MKNIFIGMIFVFINLNLDIDTTRIGLIPTFVGYIFMVRGLSELVGISDRFLKVKPFAIGMAIYSIVLYALDLLGISLALGWSFSYILSLISSAVSLFISYGIIMGIKDIEIMRLKELNSERLYTAWKLLAFTSIASHLLIVIVPMLAFMSTVISLIIGVYYLFVFNETKNLYHRSLREI